MTRQETDYLARYLKAVSAGRGEHTAGGIGLRDLSELLRAETSIVTVSNSPPYAGKALHMLRSLNGTELHKEFDAVVGESRKYEPAYERWLVGRHVLDPQIFGGARYRDTRRPRGSQDVLIETGMGAYTFYHEGFNERRPEARLDFLLGKAHEIRTAVLGELKKAGHAVVGENIYSALDTEDPQRFFNALDILDKAMAQLLKNLRGAGYDDARAHIVQDVKPAPARTQTAAGLSLITYTFDHYKGLQQTYTRRELTYPPTYGGVIVFDDPAESLKDMDMLMSIGHLGHPFLRAALKRWRQTQAQR